MKYSFKNDYTEGCHPLLLEALMKTNTEQHLAYGSDVFSQKTEGLIKEKCNYQDLKVHFVSGGTQANLIVISAFLRPHESVISAKTGHIFTNEAGAIEATGHKIHAVESKNGKLNIEAIEIILSTHQNKPHQLKPKMVYISNSTELGSIYTKNELTEISEFCKANSLYLYMDGARLGHALMARENDLNLMDIAQLCDVFYLGGTKNGALLGEAIVICNPDLQPEFEFHIKQKGAMLAKSRLIGIQFYELLKDNLYFELANHANVQTQKIGKAFQQNKVSFLVESYTNQIFPILDHSLIEKLQQNFDFYVWQKMNEQQSAIRMICSWATPDQEVNRFIENLNHLMQSPISKIFD